MGFLFDGLGALGALVSLYSFISEKLTDDSAIFKSRIRRDISIICDSAIDSLSSSHELKGIIPSYVDDVIYDAVVEALENQRPLDTIGIQNKLSMNNHILDELLAQVISKLHTSFEYSQRDYNAWLRQKTKDIESSLYSIEKNTAEIKKRVVFDSAQKHSKPPSGKSRFHFTTRGEHFVAFDGRQTELDALKNFCGFNSNMEKLPQQPGFSWWAITGSGGTGKSRLCYEFAKIMESTNWTICYPASHDMITLRNCSESLPNDTLFILDYSEFNTTDIFSWINLFGTEQFRDVLVRVILIQRTGDSLEDVKFILIEAKPDSFIAETAFNNGVFLKLPMMQKDTICNIQRDYAQHNRLLSDEELELLYSYLCKIDKEIRPLYAIILADAYLESPSEVTNWSKKEDILDYIFVKETKLIKKQTLEYCGNNAFFEIGLSILIMSTMTGEMNIDKEFENLLPDEYKSYELKIDLHSKFHAIPLLFGDNGESNYCSPLEPDIIGEYFVVKYLDELRGQKIEKLISSAWKKPYFMSRFVGRLYQDFGELMISRFYEKFFRYAKISDSAEIISNATFYNNQILKFINIPDSVSIIGREAFAGCENLKEIKIPTSVTNIGEGAFRRCNSLVSVDIPDSVTAINTQTFAVCRNLISVTIPNSVVKIEYGAFEGCKNLTSAIIPNSVVEIGNRAFWGCASLTSVIIGDSVETIGDWAFLNCVKLESLILPNSITEIGDRAFSRCKSLTSIEIPDSITKIYGAFKECTNLASVIIPSSVTHIFGTFEDCINLKMISIPDSVVTIDACAFKGCVSLTSITIPSSVTNIGYMAFDGCTMLTSIEIPSSVTTIEWNAFSGCTNLEKIIIPDSVVDIEFDAFEECEKLKVICTAGSFAEQYAKENNIIIELM